MAFLAETPADYRDTPALITGEGVVTYRSLARNADKVARQLVTLGIRQGDRVALKGHPSEALITALHGVWKAGGVALPLNPRWSPDEEALALNRLAPVLLLLGEGEAAPEASSGASALRTVSLGPTEEERESLAGLWPDTAPLPGASANRQRTAEAIGLLTSGTAGEPKILTLTFGNLLASALGAQERLALHPSDRWLASLSLAHVGGIALVTRAALLGSGLVLGGRFRAESFRQLVAHEAITHASLVPTMLRQFLTLWGDRPAPRSLRCLLIGGAHADGELIQETLARGFPLALTYGLTEASSQVATASPDLVRRKPGTVGPPLPGVEIRVREDGEILVRGETVAPGQAGKDGWLRTGDLGRLDPDGHLWVVGRISNRIISGGVNVDPAEVEAVLRTHPGVREAVVVGIPDKEWGERVVAAVSPREGERLVAGELDRLARAVLSSAKRPRRYSLQPSLPRNPNGKVDRGRIRALFQ